MPQELLVEYLPVLIFIAIAAGLSIIMVVASYLAAKQNPDNADLKLLMTAAGALMCVFIWYRFFLLFLIWKLPFCFHGRFRWEQSV